MTNDELNIKKGITYSTVSENKSILFENCPDVLTVSELQAVLKIGRTSAYQLIAENKIDSFRIGKSVRISKTALIDFVLCSQSCYNKFEGQIIPLSQKKGVTISDSNN